MKLVCSLVLSLIACSTFAQKIIGSETVTPRMRVIIDNDFGGDPDGLFQLAHHLLSPSVEVRAIIGSHLSVQDGFDPSKTQAQNAARAAKELVDAMGLKTSIPILAGSEVAMVNDSTPVKSEAVDFIVKEALRPDTKLPLYVVCGAGLTEIASALLINPEIASTLTLIWIGGPEYTDLALPPPNYSTPEYNLNIDVSAARVVFNRSTVPVWQVPRNAYRQCIIPYSMLLLNVKPHGKTGAYLTGAVEDLMKRVRGFVNIGETYILGDSPLVLLTALQTGFEADPASSFYVLKTSPLITAQGTYAVNQSGRLIRVYNDLDVDMMFDDFLPSLNY